MTAPADTLRDMTAGTTVTAALEFFDGLPAVTVPAMFGRWAGGEIPTGNPLDGLLARVGWHGKRFDSAEEAHPLVMDRAGGGTFNLRPGVVPLPWLLGVPALLRSRILARGVRAVAPVLGTRAPRARLRPTEYRGVVSATMCYNDLPIHDVFRRVDDDTVLGVMDLRGMDRPFVFFLCRES
ncbi:DUF4334 domain-containing protein [Pseudonocardia nematodicida]|uniref:DUF4334 domain-containing protein n=1 Tax=Pseudonocardia nematodicida TaxID=1206997 RepID=A0ABV1K6B0_9PSEU